MRSLVRFSQIFHKLNFNRTVFRPNTFLNGQQWLALGRKQQYCQKSYASEATVDTLQTTEINACTENEIVPIGVIDTNDSETNQDVKILLVPLDLTGTTEEEIKSALESISILSKTFSDIEELEDKAQSEPEEGITSETTMTTLNK